MKLKRLAWAIVVLAIVIGAAPVLGATSRPPSGNVGVNGMAGSPYSSSGGWKQSGLGREWGHHGLEEFTEVKSISWS